LIDPQARNEKKLYREAKARPRPAHARHKQMHAYPVVVLPRPHGTWARKDFNSPGRFACNDC